MNAEVHMQNRLVSDAQSDEGGKDFIESLNRNSLKVLTTIVELSTPSQTTSFNLSGMGPL